MKKSRLTEHECAEGNLYRLRHAADFGLELLFAELKLLLPFWVSWLSRFRQRRRRFREWVRWRSGVREFSRGKAGGGRLRSFGMLARYFCYRGQTDLASDRELSLQISIKRLK
jgi:hypothetical protein